MNLTAREFIRHGGINQAIGFELLFFLTRFFIKVTIEVVTRLYK
jgi:hypothetical protein